ncbi:hypothetical protein SDC9_177240 [bioreactor metagenome]|uniref:Uncharacterized protein n=1 Tax=bioreactor metagenome TaxID=1076179 RepID=A0A645GSA1_9ZZZZ
MADERSYSRSLLVRRMQEKGCVILTGAKVESVVGEQVTYSQGGSTVTLTGVDTVVAAMGTRPAGGLVQALEGSSFPVYSVGDCAAVGRIYEALRAGAQAAEIL